MANGISWTWTSRPRVVFVYILPLLFTVAEFSHQSELKLNRIDGTSRSQVIIFDQSRVGVSNPPPLVNNQEEDSFARRSRRAADSCSRVTSSEKSGLERLESTFEFKNDSNFNLALVWLGENGKELLALTTMDFGIFVGQSNLWISKDFGTTFVNKNNEIKNAIIRQDYGINKSPDPRKVIFVGFVDEDFTNTVLYITEDSGENIKKAEIQFYIEGPLVYHHSNSDYILAHSPTDQYSLWLSTDFGKHWNLLEKWVHSFRWGEKTKDDDNIYIVIDQNMMVDEKSFDLILKRRRISQDSFKELLKGVHTFGVQDKFVFASINSDEMSGARILMVSTNDGEIWHEAQLPSLTQDMFYSVLDSTEDMIFVHVDEAGNNGYGEIYTSDTDGIVFSRSLERHLYPNGGDVTDFYRVLSIRGVYLASQIMADQSVRTRITFNRGAEWGNVKIQSDNQCEEDDETCNLQIHNQFSKSQGVNIPMGPLSNSNAVGLILVHGHLGTELHSSPPDIYITEDGGYSWRKAIDGPHHYAITNYGALLVAIPQTDSSTNIVRYSVDAGQCWHDFVFNSKPVAVTGLLPEPNFKSLKVNIWGYDMDTRVWMVFSIDFSAVLEKTCSDDDFETWTPHESNKNQGCVLGYSETFRHVQRGSKCTVDTSYNHQDYQTTNPCKCTADDYDCDFGFYREDGEGPCKLDPGFTDQNIDICVDNEEEKEITKGYRLIPGDKCQNGFQPERNLEDMHQHCDELILSAKHSKHSGLKVFTILVLLVLIAACIGFLYVKRYSLMLPCFKRKNFMYSYKELSQKEELDNELDKALNLDVQSHVYHDESDEDMLT